MRASRGKRKSAFEYSSSYCPARSHSPFPLVYSLELLASRLFDPRKRTLKVERKALQDLLKRHLKASTHRKAN